MERYTEKHYDGNGYYLICSGNCETFNCGDCGILDKIVDRLAAYEDTGLEPEDFKRTFTEDALLKLTGQLLGVTPDRLRELAKTVQVVLIPQDVLDGGEAVNSVSHKLFWYTPYIKAIIFSDVIYSTTGKLFFLGHPFHTHSSLQISA